MDPVTARKRNSDLTPLDYAIDAGTADALKLLLAHDCPPTRRFRTPRCIT